MSAEVAATITESASMTVEVNAIPYDDKGENNSYEPPWGLEFKLASGDNCWSSEFTFADPGIHSLERWQALMYGHSAAPLTLHVKQWGEDECEIAVEAQEGRKQIVFTFASGSVDGIIRMPFELVAPKLLAALNDADELKFRFG